MTTNLENSLFHRMTQMIQKEEAESFQKEKLIMQKATAIPDSAQSSRAEAKKPAKKEKLKIKLRGELGLGREHKIH